ncbi:hypothetical protein [Litorimonas sp. WD9-15]|uniref:hypothetical protein n=1 Tax=Litorimonas sp. WD9-15 TaxID=3418716 RepID=UPI003D094A43
MDNFIDNREHLDEIVKGLQFSYIETYSIMRNHLSETERTLHKQLYYKKVSQKEISESDMLLLKSFDNLDRKNTFYSQSMLFGTGERLNSSAVRTNRYAFDEPIAQRLMSILSIPYESHFDWMCAPIYRDAVVFRNQKNKIIMPLNICFSCTAMLVNDDTSIIADQKTFKSLKEFFIEIGHDILNDIG